jgi:hypothetical protein
MKLRCLQSTYIHTPKGPLYVKGIERDDEDNVVASGEIIEVADDFVVNPDVWEVVEPPKAGKPRFVVKRGARASPAGTGGEPTA